MKKAHSLIELIAVIVIMGIAFLTVFVVVSSTSVQTLDKAERRIMADIRFAQSLAMSSGQWFGIRFNIPQNHYNVYRYDPGSSEVTVKNPLNPARDLKIYLGLEYNKTSIVQVQGNQDSGKQYILFRTDGAPCDSAGIPYTLDSQITLGYTGQAPFYRFIHVAPQTGKVSVGS